jgi:hypothetical protein
MHITEARSTMHCAHCGRPVADTVPLSTHHTSEGWVRYRRCGCGSVSVELLTLDPQAGALSGARAGGAELMRRDLHTARA